MVIQFVPLREIGAAGQMAGLFPIFPEWDHVFIRCDRSRTPLSFLLADDLHLAIAITDTMPAPYVSIYWSERPVWTCGRGYQIVPGAPVKLIAHPDGCHYRKRMLDALGAEGATGMYASRALASRPCRRPSWPTWA